jgi:iron complex outermembrane receptor protein
MAKTSFNYAVPVLVLNLAAATGAIAQDTSDAAAPAAQAARPVAKDEAIQEVVVTSQRRAMKVQDIPIAATVMTGDQLKDKAVVRMADLQAAAPALTVGDAGLTSFVNIRGIGLASGSPQVANGVATYIDGLFQPPIVTSSTFYDIANIEVLRGPQGTLVGSNSTGGAVMITTNNPSLGRWLCRGGCRQLWCEELPGRRQCAAFRHAGRPHRGKQAPTKHLLHRPWPAAKRARQAR